MGNKPIAGWRVTVAFWGVAGALAAAVKSGFGDGAGYGVFTILLILTSTYLYSRRFAGMVNRLLERWNFI